MGTGRRHVSVPERLTTAELPEQERINWLRAVEFYRDSVCGSFTRDLAHAFEVARVKLPENLWHALIFASPEEFTKSVAKIFRKQDETRLAIW